MDDSTIVTPGADVPARTRTARVAAYFRARPGQWLDGRILASVGGTYAWRSRVSDASREHGLTIENRQRRIRTVDGETVIASEYRLVDEVSR